MMKHIKTYKIFENNNSNLISELERYDIRNYIVNNDGYIDVDGNVYLHSKELKKIPFNFGKVNSYFNCSYNQLTSLEGSPIEVGEQFNCSRNNLTSLEHCASEIGGNFYCSYNQLKMLDCSSYVKGDIVCRGMFKQEPEFFGDCEGKIFW